MKTFKDLYEKLQGLPDETIYEYLNRKWSESNKQESLFRLFAYLKLIEQFKSYAVCDGCYDTGSCVPAAATSKLLSLSLKDKNSKSDLTLMNETEKRMLIGSSKETCHGIGEMDIEKIKFHFDKYAAYKIRWWFLVNDKNELLSKATNSEFNNIDLKKIILKTHMAGRVFDKHDLNKWYIMFKNKYSMVPIESINSTKEPMQLKFHQELAVRKMMALTADFKPTSVLLGHIPRSGKSYIIAGAIYEDDKRRAAPASAPTSNYLLLTTAPNETIDQFKTIFETHMEFSKFKVHVLTAKTKKAPTTPNNIVICSKQFLQIKLKEKKLDWLNAMPFNICFVDESHNGGTTELTKDVLNAYSSKQITCFVTATYMKPATEYSVPVANQITWDLEDIQLCKTITTDASMARLVEKYGREEINRLLPLYPIETIVEEYNTYPMIQILTRSLKDIKKERILEKTKDNDYGWSCESILLLQNDKKKISSKFVNEDKVVDLLYSIFGKRDEDGIPDKAYENNYMRRIEENYTKKPMYSSRFLSEAEPLIILCFLPCGNSNYPIELLSAALEQLIETKKLLPELSVVSINSKKNKGSNPKDIIDDAYVAMKNGGTRKKGLLVLSGRQCSMGVTLKKCDIVLLLNSSESSDMIQQMMFRCMTEDVGKKCGFVIDLNIQRTIRILYEYAARLFPSSKSQDGARRILEQRLITVNEDDWNHEITGISFDGDGNKLTLQSALNHFHNLWISQPSQNIKDLFQNFKLKTDLFSKKDQEFFNALFYTKTLSKRAKKIIEEVIQEAKDADVKIGIEDKGKADDESDDENNEEGGESQSNINFMTDVMRHLIPLVSILTIDDGDSTTFEQIMKKIKNNDELCGIFLAQLKTWWGEKQFDGKTLQITANTFVYIYKKYLSDMRDFNQKVSLVKELFLQNLANKRRLSELIDEYLIPQELEKKTNAEVSTPYKLRNEMLDKIPIEFWSRPNTVFEPCSGKGGFLIDIVDRFMNGLAEKIPDEQQRYKTIVEKCLYWSDINPTNKFIARLLLDPCKIYNLNYNVGNTLEINIKEKWKLNGFDAVIGNPPYNSSGSIGTGNTIWQHFVSSALNQWLAPNGLLLYVHPPGWRKPNTAKSKFIGLFELMTKNNTMLYLEMHNINDGKKTFNCGTRYDWYLIIKHKEPRKTTIKDDEGQVGSYDIQTLEWLPNSNIAAILKMLNGEKPADTELCEVIHSESAYIPRKEWVNETQTEEYKFPLIHSTPKTGVRYMYSSRNDLGHFGIPKIIFGDSGINDIVVDINGEYGLTQHAIGIKIDTLEEGSQMKKALLSDKFASMMAATMFSNFQIDWRLFTNFRKDFWKDYIELCEVIYSRSAYGSDKKHTSHAKSDEYKFPLIHSTNKSGIRYMYSSRNDLEHFGISKIIFGQSGINDVVIDLSGQYAMTECAIGIKVVDETDAINHKRALMSDKFKEYLKSLSFSTFRIDWRLFTNFRKDFWKDFI